MMSAQTELSQHYETIEPTPTVTILAFPASRMTGAQRKMAAAIAAAKPRQRWSEFDKSIDLLRKRLARLGMSAKVIEAQTADLTRGLGRELKKLGIDGGWDVDE